MPTGSGSERGDAPRPLADHGAAVLPARDGDDAPDRIVLKHLAAAPATQWVLVRLVFLYARFAYATTRWRMEGFEHVRPHIAGAPVIVAFWHERQALMPMLWVLARRQGGKAQVHVLSSRHRDGRFMAAVVQGFGMRNVFGSTRRGGAAGLRHLTDLLAAGDHIAITPDGPRGPRREAAAGVAQIASLANVPVLPCAAQSSRRICLRTWDRMVVPLPFGRAVIVCEPVILVPREGWQEVMPAIAAAMTRAAETADRLVKP